MGCWKQAARGVDRQKTVLIFAHCFFLATGSFAMTQQPGETTLEEIANAWRDRGRRFESGKISWSVTRFLAKGAISDSSEHSPFPMKAGTVVPPNDVKQTFTNSLTFQGNRMRYCEREPMWSEGLSRFGEDERLSAFDGRTTTSLSPFRTSGQQIFRFQGMSRPSEKIHAAMGRVAPIRQHFFPEVSTIDKLKRYRITSERVPVDGATCVSLVRTTLGGLRETMLVDPRAGFILRQVTRASDEGIRSQCQMLFSESNHHGHLLMGWKEVEYGLDGGLRESRDCEITDLQINVPIEGSEFRIDFPPRTLVADEGGEGERSQRYFVVLDDGRRRPVTLEELRRQGVTWELLAATKPGEAGLPAARDRLFWAWPLATLLALAAVYVFVARKRRRSIRQ